MAAINFVPGDPSREPASRRGACAFHFPEERRGCMRLEWFEIACPVISAPARPDLVERQVFVRARVGRQAEHPFADNVAKYLIASAR